MAHRSVLLGPGGLAHASAWLPTLQGAGPGLAWQGGCHTWRRGQGSGGAASAHCELTTLNALPGLLSYMEGRVGDLHLQKAPVPRKGLPNLPEALCWTLWLFWPGLSLWGREAPAVEWRWGTGGHRLRQTPASPLMPGHPRGLTTKSLCPSPSMDGLSQAHCCCLIVNAISCSAPSKLASG